MKKLLAVLVVLNLFAIPLQAATDRDYTEREIDQCAVSESTIVAVTATSQALTFQKPTKAIYLENLDAANTAYVNLNSTTATVSTTDQVVLAPLANRSVQGFLTNGIGLVMDTGETASVAVEVCY